MTDFFFKSKIKSKWFSLIFIGVSSTHRLYIYLQKEKKLMHYFFLQVVHAKSSYDNRARPFRFGPFSGVKFTYRARTYNYFKILMGEVFTYRYIYVCAHCINKCEPTDIEHDTKTLTRTFNEPFKICSFNLLSLFFCHFPSFCNSIN